MWTISQWICLLSLAGVSVIDILKRKVPVWTCAVSLIAAVGYQLYKREMSVWVILGGVLIGTLFLLLSKVTREGMGYGDSLGICVLGIYLGGWQLLEVLSTAFFLLFFSAVLLFIKRKNKRNVTIPFYPFLFSGYVVMLLVEKGGIG